MRPQLAGARVRPSTAAPEQERYAEAPRLALPSSAVREDTTAPERIRAILTTAAALGRPGLLRGDGQQTRLRLERVDLAAGQLHWSHEAPDTRWGPAPYEVEVRGHDTLYRLHLPRGTWEAGRGVTPFPTRIEQVRRRLHRRAPAPASLRVRLPLPGWLGREREVLDVSLAGLGLHLSPGEQLAPGRLLQPLVVLQEDGQALRLRAEVRHVSSGRCGLRVEPLERADAEGWRELVTRALYPSTRTDGALVEGIWQLFTDSGYFNLAGRSAAWFEERRTSFLELGRRAARLSDVLCEVVWPSERGVEATLSAMKPYRSVWLVHQLARRQGGSRFEAAPGQMLRDIYVRAVEHARADPGFRWLGAYIESTVPFIRRSHARFAEQLAGKAPVLLLPLRMIDVACDAPAAEHAPDLDVGPATPAERALLVRELARTRPAPYVEALDLGPDALDLEDAARPWRAEGLERERHLLVARRQGTPLALAVLEVGPAGTNPFRLLDSARLFPLSPLGREAFPALLDAARRWYASRGRDGFVFLAEEEGAVEAAGLHDEAPEARPYLWLIPASLAPEFLEHLHEQTVSRLPSTHEKEPS